MKSVEVLKSTLDTSMLVLNSYLSDLTDEELLERPGTGCNHLAWQLGHLVSSQNSLIEMVSPGSSIELPVGFVTKHSKDHSLSDMASDFYTKEAYQELFEKVNEAIKSAFSSMTDSQLDAPGPEGLAPMFPTVGSACILIASHPMMHAGQFVPVRRRLGKPVLI